MLSIGYVEKVLVHHAAPCLAGIKSANLVSFPDSSIDWCTAYNQLLNRFDIYFIPLNTNKTYSQILICRKSLLMNYILRPDVYNELCRFGYNPKAGFAACISRLQERMSTLTKNFPHEIGLFLGYPVEDVLQYIATGGKKCLFCGYWKVYSSPEKASKIFDAYTECKERFALQIKSGMSLSQIIQAA